MAKKRGGIGAAGSAIARFFHPSAHIRAKWPNDYQRKRLTNVLITGKGMHRVNRKDQLCYECRIPEIDADLLDEPITFHIVCNNFRVDRAGIVPFEDEMGDATAPAQEAVDETIELRTSRDDVRRSELSQEISDLRQQGIEVDDDNDPAPENADPPQPTSHVGEWVTPTICARKEANCSNRKGTWKNYSWKAISEMDEFAQFRMCFPEKWVREVVIPATNERIKGDPINLSEFYVFLGCHFFMACFEGISDRNYWWSQKDIDMFEGAPFRLNGFISLNRFKEISAAMEYTNKPPPQEFVDKFHDVRQMIDAFNDHYAEEYIPSWLSCLDESMNSWLNKFCPGFMNVPRKPYPNDNEYHSIADRDDGQPVMWRIKIREGKDRPKDVSGKWAFPSEFEGTSSKGRPFTATSTLMCEMTKPIHGTGKVVSMDSGFCVSAGILHLHDLGVYGQALIKKRKYWPKGVPGDDIDVHFAEKRLGYCESLKQDMEGIPFYVHCCKDSKYVTKMMSTHGLLTTVPDHITYRQKPDGTWESFNYAEFLSNHNRSKHWVDDVNNRRHDPIGLEEVWHTKWWPTRQFTFICSVAESNAVHCKARALKAPTTPQLEFRRNLAKQMLMNKLGDDGTRVGSPVRPRKRGRDDRIRDHDLESRPNFTGKWDNSTNSWTKITTRYCKIKCGTCNNKVRTFCKCNKSVTMCVACFGNHVAEVRNTN